ncbi:MAG TPA: hypothetical protein DIW77_00530 [Chromatiaceae bacterium]|nr:hypothetical protein [Chromatiaceae bacterium]
MVSLGVAWLGVAWLGVAWLGVAWLGAAWLGAVGSSAPTTGASNIRPSSGSNRQNRMGVLISGIEISASVVVD